MEPKLPASNSGLERSPVNYGENLEQSPDSTRVERVGDLGAERPAQPVESAPATPILPTPLVVPAPVVPTPVASDSAIISDAPLVAADEDLIEKEWVDRAKKILQQTKDDPFLREQEVSKLQADYLRKRYGKELGASS